MLRVAAAQLCSKAVVQDNLTQCISLGKEAASWNADLLVFPENTPFMGGGEERPSIAESMDGQIVSTFREMAREHQMAVSFGFHETSQEETRSYNTSVFLNPEGEVVQAYRKIHLFSPNVEHRHHRAGDRVWLHKEGPEVSGFFQSSIQTLHGTHCAIGFEVCH